MIRPIPFRRPIVFTQVVTNVLDATYDGQQLLAGAAVLGLDLTVEALRVPPTRCPCGFGPIGFIIPPYLMLLGCPTIFTGVPGP